MLAHVGLPAHASIAKAVELFGIREGSFDCLFAPGIDVSARGGFRKGIRLIVIVLPDMPSHHLSCIACREARSSSGA